MSGLQDPTGEVYLPDEVIIRILTLIPPEAPHAQKTYAACARTSWQWYECATPFLYASPRLHGPNFTPFVATICPSINLHVRRSRLAALVKILDLGALVHQGSRSMTARLLGRVKGNLEKFRAPQASFAVNCLPALSKCMALTQLDLSLVSESPPLPELFRSISGLASLKTLYLPRCAGFGSVYGTATASSSAPVVTWNWPPKLSRLSLSGGIDMHFVRGKIVLPSTLTDLTIEHFPTGSRGTVRLLLKSAVSPLPNLKKLKIANMPRLVGDDLDTALQLLPQVEVLSIGAEYISGAIFDIEKGLIDHPPNGSGWSDRRPYESLHTLELTNTSLSAAVDVSQNFAPIDVVGAVEDGILPALRRVRVVKSLGWSSMEKLEQDTDYLDSALEDQATAQGDECETGVWEFEDKFVR